MSNGFITEFCITSDIGKPRQSFLTEIPRDVVQKIHQRVDLSAIYYTPQTVFADLQERCSSIAHNFVKLRDIPAESVILFHCSTYAQRYDYHAEELNMKAIILSKEYDIAICTGRTLSKHYCSDLMYVDRFFSYRFGDRKYWFTCYSRLNDGLQLIRDKLEDLFGSERGLQIFTQLSQQISRLQ